MNASSAPLFVLGLVLEVVGFMLRYSERFPFLLTVMSPGRGAGSMALDRLISVGELGPDDAGFNEVARVAAGEARSGGQTIPGGSVPVERLRLADGGAMVTFAPRPGELVTCCWIDIELTGGGRSRVDLMQLRRVLDARTRRAIFMVAASVFLAGVVLQVLGFLVAGESRRALPN
jgi:hypothetical protein